MAKRSSWVVSVARANRSTISSALIPTDRGHPKASWRPVIQKVATLTPCGTYSIAGSQLNGLTQGAYYGDDYQSVTNYPLVRITNDRTGRVFYARTLGMSSMAVTPMLESHAQFQIPARAPRGKAMLVVAANGIPSPSVAVTIR